MAGTRRQKTKETFITDSISGEILSANRETIQYQAEESFVKLYIERLPLIYGLPNQHGRILLALMPKMNFDNEIVLKKEMKEQIAVALGIKLNTVEHALSDLVTAGILLRKGSGYYFVNPHVIAKGSWTHIREIRQTITWNYDGINSVAEFIKKPDAIQLKTNL